MNQTNSNNNQSVETANNEKNSQVEIRNLSNWDFFRIRDAVIKVQHGLIKKGSTTMEGIELAKAWEKLEYAWYESLKDKEVEQ